MILKAKDNNLYLYGIIWDGDERYFDQHFTNLEGKYNDINIFLHTKGGDVFAGNFIIQRLQNSKAHITINVVGTAFSMGAIILTAGDKRTMVSNGFIMVHAPKGGVYGTAQDHRNAAKLLSDMEEQFIQALGTITNLPESKIKKLMNGDNYFNAKEALKIGLVDEIIDPITPIKIDNVQDMRPDDIFGMFSAIMANDKGRTKIKNNMKKEIIEAFGLSGVSVESSDTAIIQAVKEHYDAKLKDLQAKLEKERESKQTLEKIVNEQKKAKINALLAPLKGKITKEQEQTYRDIAEKSGIQALETILSSIKTHQPLNKIIGGKMGNDVFVGRENWDWDKWQQEDPRGLERMAQENPEDFLALGKEKFGQHFTI